MNISKKAKISICVLLFLIGLVGFTHTQKGTISYAADQVASNGRGITNITIPSDSKGAIGDKIYVNLEADMNVVANISLFLKPTKTNGGTVVYLKSNTKDLTRNTYFIIPEDVVVGEEYELTQVTVYKKDQSSQIYSTTSGTDYPVLDTGSKRFFTVLEKSDDSKPKVEKVELDSFAFTNNVTKEIQKIPVKLDFYGLVDWGSISFESIESSDISFTASIQNINGEQYINLSNSNSFPGPGEYKVKQVFLCHNENGCTVFSSDASYPESESFTFPTNLIIEAEEEEEEEPELDDDGNVVATNYLVDKISFSSRNVGFGDKVSVEIVTEKKIDSILLFLEDGGDNSVSAYVKDIGEKPYFIIPSNVEDGKYYLKSAIVKSSSKTEYFTTKQDSILDLNSSITVNNSNITRTNQLIINNDTYKEAEYTAKFKNLDEDAIINVTASSNSMIDKSLFEAIKETRRKLVIEYKESEWVFSGTDIKQAKTIDASIMITNVKDSAYYENLTEKDIPDDAAVISFVNNGELPGKVLMRIKSEEIDTLFANKKANVYYYDEDEDDLQKVALEVQKNNGYYEFYINHNSIYVLSTKKASDNKVSKNNDLLEMNDDLYKEPEPVEEENGIDISTVLLIIFIVLLVIVFIVSSIKGSSKKTDDDYE